MRPSRASMKYEEFVVRENTLKIEIINFIMLALGSGEFGVIRLENGFSIKKEYIVSSEGKIIYWDTVTASQALEIYAAIVKTLNN